MDERVMRSSLNDMSLIENENFVAGANRGKPCAMITQVVPRMRMRSRMYDSVTVSSAEVASSRISTLGLATRVRAISSCCRCPPL